MNLQSESPVTIFGENLRPVHIGRPHDSIEMVVKVNIEPNFVRSRNLFQTSPIPHNEINNFSFNVLHLDPKFLVYFNYYAAILIQ